MGGGASAAKSAPPSGPICAAMPAEPTFKALDLNEEIDGLFDTVKVLFTDLTKLNDKLNDQIKDVMGDDNLLALEQKNRDLGDKSKFPAPGKAGDETANLSAMVRNGVIAGRAGIDPSLPEAEVKKIRALVAKPDLKKADEEAKKTMGKQKDKVLPKVDASKAKEGIVEISLPPSFDKEAVKGKERKLLDKVLVLFELVQKVGNTEIKELKGRIEGVLKEIKEKAGPSKLTAVAKEKTKDMGMGDKLKYLKEKGGELKENGMSAAVVKDFMMVLVNKVRALGQIFVEAWGNAVTYAMKYEVDAKFIEDCPAAPKKEDYFPTTFGTAKGSEAREKVGGR